MIYSAFKLLYDGPQHEYHGDHFRLRQWQGAIKSLDGIEAGHPPPTHAQKISPLTESVNIVNIKKSPATERPRPAPYPFFIADCKNQGFISTPRKTTWNTWNKWNKSYPCGLQPFHVGKWNMEHMEQGRFALAYYRSRWH